MSRSINIISELERVLEPVPLPMDKEHTKMDDGCCDLLPWVEATAKKGASHLSAWASV